MGVEIVKAATVYGGRLSGNAFKVLVAMSLSALDKPSNGRPASLYWGGWDALALTLGHENADRQTAGHNAVARAIRELRGRGHITPMVDAKRGSRQSYLVHPGGLSDPSKGEQNAHAKGEQNAHAKGEQNAQQRVSKMLTPRKEQGSKGLTQDTQLPVVPEPQDACPVDAAHAFEGQPGDECVACGGPYLNRTIHPFRLLRGGA